MNAARQQRLEELVRTLEEGRLTAQGLREGIAALLESGRQDLLYLQASSTAPSAQLVGMMLVEGGQMKEPPPDPAHWPYQSVLDALKDGWRVLSFPNMALLATADDEHHGLGFEFILEKWR